MSVREKLTAGTTKGFLFVLFMLFASLVGSPALAFVDADEISSLRAGFVTSGLCPLAETVVEADGLELDPVEAAGPNPDPGVPGGASHEVQHAARVSGDPLTSLSSFALRERRNWKFNARAPPQPE